MPWRRSFTVSFLACLACSQVADPPPQPAPPPEARWQLSDDLEVRRLTPTVYLHVSWNTLDDGTRFPSNGLVVVGESGVWLVDTAWGNETTRELLGWVERELGQMATGVVATHHHDDRLGGAVALAERRVPLHVSAATDRLASEGGHWPAEAAAPALLGELRPGDVVHRAGLEIVYAGPGHALDNLFVWVPAAKLLFGGCAVRAAGTTSLGNVADADIGAWPETIRRVRDRYPEARIVVPGHGEPGGADLLEHTLGLLSR